MLDVFETNAFTLVTLTDAINKIKFVPRRIDQLGLFQDTAINTTTIVIEQKDNVLVHIPPTPRGAPGTTVDKPKRNVRNLTVPHFEIKDAIYADEVQNVRAFGSESVAETVMGKVAERLRDVHLPSHVACLYRGGCATRRRQRNCDLRRWNHAQSLR
jgi:Phage major capsid protein E